MNYTTRFQVVQVLTKRGLLNVLDGVQRQGEAIASRAVKAVSRKFQGCSWRHNARCAAWCSSMPRALCPQPAADRTQSPAADGGRSPRINVRTAQPQRL